MLEIGVAALGEGAQQIERCRRLAVGHDLAFRIGLAALKRCFRIVDDVAAIDRIFDAVDRLGWRPSAAWRTGRRCGRPSPPAGRRRRSGPPTSAGRRGRNRGYCRRNARRSFRRSRRPGAGNPCPRRRAASLRLSLRASPAKTSGGKPARRFSTTASFACIVIVRHLHHREFAPAVRCPVRQHLRYSKRHRRTRHLP